MDFYEYMNFMHTHTMYLPRALEFIYVFLDTFVSGEQDLAVCARKAYGTTLKRYHGWMVQGIFSVSDKSTDKSRLYLEVCTLVHLDVSYEPLLYVLSVWLRQR